MKPSIFRSVSDALAESFPLLPRIRRSFFGLMLFSLLLMSMQISTSDHISFPVKQNNLDTTLNRISVYEKATISSGYQFTIDNPSLLERLLLPGEGPDLVTLFVLVVISLIIVRAIPKLQQNNLFRKDISYSLRLLGYVLLAHGVFSLFSELQFIPGIVEQHTNNTFTSIRYFPIVTMAEMYFALVLMAWATIYKRGIKLQEEQDLTV